MPWGKPKKKSVAIALQQMAVMLASGVQILQIFKSLSRQMPDKALIPVVDDIDNKVTRLGYKLSKAFADHPDVFPPYVCMFVQAGEETGDLSSRLRRAGLLMERESALQQQVKAALTAPFLTLVVASLVLFLSVKFVMPRFIGMYEGMKISLPAITQGVIGVVQVLNHPVFLIGLAILILALIVQRRQLSEQAFNLLLRIPRTSRWVGIVLCAQFCDILGSLIREGVPILAALGMIARSATYPKHRAYLLQAHRTLLEQGDFATAIKEIPYFPRMLYSISLVGQEIGSLDQLLHSLNKILEQDVDHTIAAVVSLLEPIMISIMGVVSAFFFIGMFLPVYEILQHLGE